MYPIKQLFYVWLKESLKVIVIWLKGGLMWHLSHLHTTVEAHWSRIVNVKTDKKNQVLLLFYFFSLRAKRAPSLNNSIDGIFKLMLLYYEECGIFKGFGCPTYEEEYDRCTNFQFPRQSAKFSNVSNKKNVREISIVRCFVKRATGVGRGFSFCCYGIFNCI